MLTLSKTENDLDCVIKHYNCDFTVKTAGDGLWGCEAGRPVRVTHITVIDNDYDGEVYTMVNVMHDSTWNIYTDTAFEAAISEAVGFAVRFTEQGMQEDKWASLEA